MDVYEFVKTYQPKFSEYCPCIIDWEGQVYECETSHLNELIKLCGDEEVLNEIPENVSPLFYLTAKLRCVVVDYENQVYNEELSQEQRYAILALADAKLILTNLVDIHGKIEI